MITIHTTNDGESDIEVFAEILDQHVTLDTFGQTEEFAAAAYKRGAVALLKVMEEHQPSPEQIAEMAQEAARAAGVDESIIAQGGVAVGPWGAVSISSDDLTTGHEDESDLNHDDEDEGPVYE